MEFLKIKLFLVLMNLFYFYELNILWLKNLRIVKYNMCICNYICIFKVLRLRKKNYKKFGFRIFWIRL